MDHDTMTQRLRAPALEVISRVDAQGNGWRSRLIINKEGHPRPLLANGITALREAPEWAGVLAFDEFRLCVTGLKPSPRGASGPWDDQGDRLAADWLQRRGIFVSALVAGQAVETVARERSFHPVRQYLNSLEWDGVRRIDGWLSLYLGVQQSNYSSAIGARFLISAVARVFQPGCKADCALILEGPQGAMKSTSLQVLAGEWFADELGEMGTKDAALQTCGVWILELSELESLTRSEVSRVKGFMSRSTDHFRPPYARRAADFPRQCVFAGTCNQSEYLRDETGGRRFWPVQCGSIKIAELRRDRDQIWGEAVSRYRAGARWWLDTPELSQAAAVEQADRYEGDAWDELIAEWIEQPSQRYDHSGHQIQPFTSDDESVTVADVLTHCIGKDRDKWTQPDQNRVARVLRSKGWIRYRTRAGNTLGWRYRRIKP